jgi:hypothetical protein
MMISPMSHGERRAGEWPPLAAGFRALPLIPRDQVGHFMQYGA